MGNHIFVCYAREDQDFVLQLADNLRARGAPIWIDQRNIPTGTNWDRAIDHALYDCSAFLIVLSKNSVESREVQGEYHTALRDDKLIIPVLIEECRIPRQLGLYQYVDMDRRQPTNDVALEQILQSLEVETSQPMQPAQPASSPISAIKVPVIKRSTVPTKRSWLSILVTTFYWLIGGTIGGAIGGTIGGAIGGYIASGAIAMYGAMYGTVGETIVGFAVGVALRHKIKRAWWKQSLIATIGSFIGVFLLILSASSDFLVPIGMLVGGIGVIYWWSERRR